MGTDKFLQTSGSCQDYAVQNSCVVTAGCNQHEAVPYCVVEWQCPPEVKADADGIEHAANSDQKRRQSVYRAKHGSHPQQDHPAQGQVGNDRTWLDTTWTAQLYGGSSDCCRPNRGGHPDRPNAVQ